MTSFGRANARAQRLGALLGLAIAGGLWGRVAEGQSLISGSLRGQVIGTDSAPVISALVTLTDASAGAGFTLTADRRGQFRLAVVTPGTYEILVEQAGYQPVRYHGIVVRAGQQTLVTLVLERKPPPITQITDVAETPGSALSRGHWVGTEVSGAGLERLDFRREITDVSRDFSTLASPRDGRPGYAEAAGGLPQSMSRFYVDGVEETFLRHPGSLGEPAATPVFPRNSIMAVNALENATDIEWDGAPGQLVTGLSRLGSRKFIARPYLSFSSASLGGKSEDNPADSSATSFQGGAVLSGPLVRDTAAWLLGFNYESLEVPTANPWERDSTVFAGAPVSLRETLPVVAADTFGTSVAQFVTPTVRTFRGGNGFGRLDWQFSKVLGLFARFNFAKWKEQNPLLDQQLESGAGTRLDGRDLSAALGITAGWTSSANEFRIGIRGSKRDWISGSTPATILVAEGAAIGFSPFLPGLFDQRAVDINNTLHLDYGSHRMKVGVGLSFGKWKQSYSFGRNGIFTFGDLESFGDGVGDFYQLVGPGTVEFNTTDIEAYFQDLWSVTQDFQVQFGLRYDKQKFPRDQISTNTNWVNSSGITYENRPSDDNNFAPRIGLVWSPGGPSGWVVRGGGGLYFGRTSPALFSEAALFDGLVRARRAQGAFAGWPTLPDSIAAPVIGPRLTLFDRGDGYRVPRSSKWDLAISHAFRGNIKFEISGSYHHTDFLPRRTDLNLVGASVGQTSEGRPIYGSLVKQGGLVSPAVGSNRRFPSFDVVSGIVASGFSDYYATTATIERKGATGIGLTASYTFSRTYDNWMLGAGDPAAQVTPFPELPISDDWADGRSDLDIPHRLAVMASYTFPGRMGLDVAVRYRFRSGLPFTPGFRPGVDINGDGSGFNDPAFIDPAIPGADQLINDHSCLASQVGEFADRNSCREKSAHGLDLRLALRLPVQVMGGSLQLTVDAFNIVATETGLVDRAVYLIDPTQPLTTNPSGDVVVPLIANPEFGTLLSRRGEPRLVRFGLKVDY